MKIRSASFDIDLAAAFHFFRMYAWPWEVATIPYRARGTQASMHGSALCMCTMS